MLAAAFGLASLLTVSTVSRRVREFGTLKALGWRNRRILSQIMGEALAIGLIGGAAGVALGFGGAALVQALAPPLTATTQTSAPAGPGGAAGPGAGGGFAQAAQSAAHTVSVHLTAPVTLSAVLLAVVLALAGGLIAGSFGGWRAVRLRPRESQLTRVRATSIGFIFQSFNLIPTLSAQENVETALVPLGVASAERQERALRALVDVSLGERARHLPSELSGGQQQRVAIARALVKQPTVLLADEPTGNLDEGTRDEIMTLLEQLWDQLRLTLVIVSHDSIVAGRAQRTGLMENGRLTIEARPAHPIS